MVYPIENAMVVDGYWTWDEPPEVQEKLNRSGYEEIETGIFVPEEDAFEYASERVSQDNELKQEFIEWFYSNLVKED